MKTRPARHGGSRRTRTTTPSPLRIDLGCGPHKRDGFYGVDQYPFPSVDLVLDLTRRRADGTYMPWPWTTGAVDEFHASHMIEHFMPLDRVHIMNEMHRCLKVGGTVFLIAPHWASGRAYGDFTHQWPPISSFWMYYLSREWRQAQAPHTDAATNPQGYSCDFLAVGNYNLHPEVAVRNAEYQQRAVTFDTEAAQDILLTLTKR